MNISAQVIDTIVEWIDDNLHQPLRIDDIARHARVFRNGICNGCFYSTRESLGRYIRERKLLLAARDLRDTDQRVYDICLKYGFDSQQTFTRIFTRTFNQPPGAYRKENHSRALSAAAYQSASIGGLFLLSCGLICQREPAAPCPAQYQILNDSQR